MREPIGVAGVEYIMTIDTSESTDIAVVQAGFAAVARGDLDSFRAPFHDDATWNHRNDDRLGGIHDGRDAILAFLTTSMELTAGTLRPIPQSFLTDGAGLVAVPVRITGNRPDGRSFDDPQILLFAVEDGRVCGVE